CRPSAGDRGVPAGRQHRGSGAVRGRRRPVHARGPARHRGTARDPAGGGRRGAGGGDDHAHPRAGTASGSVTTPTPFARANVPELAPEPARFDAILLTGGTARRLGGVDKAGVVIGGRPLARRVASAATDACRLIVVGPNDAGLDRPTF